MKRMLMLLGALIVWVMILSGCSDGAAKPENEKKAESQTQKDKAEVQEDVSQNQKSGTEDQETGKQANKTQEVKKQDGQEIKTDSGRYQGQADSNFIEIKISGVPDEKSTKVFMLSEDIKTKFDNFKLRKDDVIRFKYFENKNQQSVIIEIEKLTSGTGNDDKSKVKDDFSIQISSGRIALMDWDNKVDFKKLLGNPLSEQKEVLGEGADTFKGSTVKKQKYNGLELTLMSPKDNGKTFYVMGIKVTGAQYKTSRGVQKGDTADKLGQLYPEMKYIEGKGKNSGKAKFEGTDGEKAIIFSLNSGKVEWFELLLSLQ